MKNSLYILEHELRIARKDPTLFAILFVMPFIVLYLVAPAMRPALIMQGYANASGAEQAMPGIAVLFGNFGMAFLAFAVFREHTWNTWDRLMYAPVSRSSILIGKALLPFGLVVMQQLVMLAAAYLVFDVRLAGSLFAYVLIAISFALFIVSAGFLCTAIFASMQQVNAVINIGSLALAGLGGAFAPMEHLPAWMQFIAPLSPNYWVIASFKQIILDKASLWQILPAAGILMAIAFACFATAIWKFRDEHQKMSWA